METRQLPWWKEPTRAQWSAFLAAWSGWVLDAFDFVIYMLVMHHIAKEFGVGIIAVSGSITLTLLVRLVGGFVAGWIADRWGRKLPLMLSLVWFAIFDAAIYFAPTFTWVIVLRTVFGFGMGAEWTAGTALAMENWPTRTRKIASGLLQAGWPIGFMLAAIVAKLVVPVYGWRAMFLIAAIPALLVVPIRFMVPDEVAHAPKSDTVKPRMGDLLEKGVLRMLILGTIVMALGFVVYYGLSSQYSFMLMSEHGFTASAAWDNVIVFQIGMLIGVVAAGWIANRFGVVTALVAPALLMIPAIPLYVGVSPALLPVGAFLGGFLGVGYSGVTPVLTTSLFPAHVRARAIGLVYHAGALIAAFVPTLIGVLAETTRLTVGGAMAIVTGLGLAAMSAAVLVLRRRLTVSAIDATQIDRAPAVEHARPAVISPTNDPELVPVLAKESQAVRAHVA
ncbi:MAG TPA: MFS transporter [Kofleriaceae bacterium]|nr:MFS transporter [Kofleriaceae bacterium]